MKYIQKYLLLLGAVVHFGTIAAFHAPKLSECFGQEIRFHRILRPYTLMSGLNGGYSFYSPSVGNTYQMQHQVQSGYYTWYSSNAQLKTSTGHIRYQSYLDIGSAFLSEKKENCHSRKLAEKATEYVNKHIATRYPNDTTSSNLVTKLIPTLQQLRKGNTLEVSYVNLFHHVEFPHYQQ